MTSPIYLSIIYPSIHFLPASKSDAFAYVSHLDSHRSRLRLPGHAVLVRWKLFLLGNIHGQSLFFLLNKKSPGTSLIQFVPISWAVLKEFQGKDEVGIHVGDKCQDL